MMTCSPRRRTQEASPPLSDSSTSCAPKYSSSTLFDDDILTPPEDCFRRKVSFDVAESSESEPEYVDSSHQTLTVSPPLSTTSTSPNAQNLLDICATRVPQEILVGLFDRAAEMKDLLSRNAGFFGILRGFVNRKEGEWQKFLAWLFTERDVVGDLEWIEGVKVFLRACPSYFEKFREIVGYDEVFTGSDEDNDRYDKEDDRYYNTNNNNNHENRNRNRNRDRDRDYNDDSDDDEDFEDGYDADNADDSDEERHYDNTFETVDLKLIRRFPARLASFERSYPQFFINARDCLCRPRGPHGITTSCPDRTPVESKRVNPSRRVEQRICTVEEEEQERLRYNEFVKLLFSPRRVLPDEEWERALLECLDGWPNLLAQLKEIVAFEVEDSWSEEENECGEIL